MKTILNNYYHKYFAEIMTSILVLLVINILLLVFGIVSARKQRAEISQHQSAKIDSTNVMLKNASNLKEILRNYKK